MVRKPDPRPLEIAARSRGQMNCKERCETVTVSYCVFWTLRNLELGSSGPAEADVRIPQSRTTLDVRMDVPL